MTFKATPDRWQVVAEAIKERRDELGLTQNEVLIRASGRVGGSTLSNLERGKKESYDRQKLKAVSRALGWSHDSIERLIAGQDPIVLTEQTQDVEVAARLWRIEEQVRDLIMRFQRLEGSRPRNGEGLPNGPGTD